MLRGDVVWVQLPGLIGPAGHEQLGARPAVILQNDQATAGLSTVAIVPLTSKLKAAAFFGAVVIDPDGTNGLSVRSIALTHQIRALDKRRIGTTVGTLSVTDMQSIEVQIRKLLAL